MCHYLKTSCLLPSSPIHSLVPLYPANTVFMFDKLFSKSASDYFTDRISKCPDGIAGDLSNECVPCVPF